MSLLRGVSLAAMCVVVGACAHASAVELGQTLSSTEQQTLTAGSPVQLGKQQFRIVTPAVRPRSTATNQGETWLVNEQGVVGRSDNVVLVGQADTAAVEAVVAGGTLPTVVQATYNAALHMSTLRFGSFADAVQARSVLAQRLPTTASVTVPVQYTSPTKR